ncbi:hypothetical protein DLJ48_01735 [Oenococcus sicerae]|uniref:O-antigen ligase family protein n=1 Tax=Oenococcus sicerae TaxID=2203724 RepID=A0ABX5QKP3_9LACO|nr:hypothetical protein [Oenococcus sicerae]QAS69332.1 hypothetical protein DLJ48_01735 [Oenococcus sicerae]
MIKKKQLYKFVILILLILQTYFFDLIPGLNSILTSFNSEFSKKAEMIFLIIPFLFPLLFKSTDGPIQRTRIFDKTSHGQWLFSLPIIFLFISVAAITIASSDIYSQTIYHTLSDYYGFFILIGYFSLHPFLSGRDNIEWFYQVAKKFCLFYIGVQILGGFVFFETGRVLFFYTPVALSNIYALGRFTEGTEFVTFMVYCVSIKPFLLQKKWVFSDYLLILFGLVFHAFLSKGRMYLLICIIVCAVSVLFQIINLKREKILKIFVPIFIFLLTLGIYRFFLSLGFTNLNGDRAASYIARASSVNYFSNHIFYNRWFGIGFPNSDRYWWLLHGVPGVDAAGGHLWYTDIGVLGTLSILGCLGIIFVGWLLIILVIACVLSKHKQVVLISLAYLLLSSISLSPLDTGRVWMFSLVLIFIDYGSCIIHKERIHV